MPRFVILHHRVPDGILVGGIRSTHWDVLLEYGPVLRAWATEQEPVLHQRNAALALPDHRLTYLDYEGEIGGGRGCVSQWDRGTYRVRQDDADRFVIDLSGSRLVCRAIFTRSPDDREAWRVHWDCAEDSVA